MHRSPDTRRTAPLTLFPHRKMAHDYGVIWDVDGTLVDTAELHFQAWSRLAAELGRPFSRADFAATFGWRNPDIIPRLFDIHAEAEVAELGNRKERYYRAAAAAGVALLPGARRLIEELHADGWRQAVGSSAPRENLELILRLTAIDSYLSAVVAMEDTRRGKPDPEVFLLAARRMGVRPERCLVLEDAPAGVQAARAAGMKCFAVAFVGHHSDADLRQAGAHQVVPSLEQVSADSIRRALAASH